MPKVLFLTRGDELWGLGHLHRTGWLAGMVAAQHRDDLQLVIGCLDSGPARHFWQGSGLPVEFVAWSHGAPPPDLINRLAPVIAAGDLVVIDWLTSPVELVTGLTALGARVVLLDEYGPAQHHAGLVINSLLAPLEYDERVAGETRVVQGARYIQVPPEVVRLRRVAHSSARAMEAGLASPTSPEGRVHSILVSFGGSPRNSVTGLILESLESLGFPGRVVVMPASGDLPGEYDLDIEFRAGGADFHSILAAVDLAVLGGGLSLYEALCLGTPVAAVAVSSATPGYEDHQWGTVTRLAGAGYCTSLGRDRELDQAPVTDSLAALIADSGRRHAQSKAGMGLIDGSGTDRTFDLILHV